MCRFLNTYYETLYLSDSGEARIRYLQANTPKRTSIGANLAEAQYGISRKDFHSKCYISLKETAETMYWLVVLRRAELLSEDEYESMNNDAEELKRLFMSITKNSKE
jgi:hypothetical protein